MIKKIVFLGLVLLIAGQFVAAQAFQMITLSADGEEASYAVSNVQKIVIEDNTMTVKMKAGTDVSNITRVSFAPDLLGVDYSKLKLNEVSGVGNDPEKFYELINTGAVDIPLEGCKIYYNANGSNGGVFPPNGNQGLTWTGSADQVAKAGELFCLIGRNTPGSFTTGLTAARILIVTLEDPAGNVIDECIRAKDTDEYAFVEHSYSRIPDGTGPFYFTTTPTPCEMNGNDATGLTLVPQSPGTGILQPKAESAISLFPNPVKEYLSVNGVKADAIINLYDLNGKLLQTIPVQENSTTIHVSSLQQGIYVLQIGEQLVKFIKQ